jgi:SsrA-binding protein
MHRGKIKGATISLFNFSDRKYHFFKKTILIRIEENMIIPVMDYLSDICRNMASGISIKNKRAYFEYHILDTYTAGIKLLGTEIKSIREAKADINDAFCTFIDGQLYVRNMQIAEYSHGSFYNHEAKRDRILLLNKKELAKLRINIEEKGFTIIPLKIFTSERGFAKLEIGLAQGKKIYDKRETLKDRDAKLEMSRAMKR